MTLALLLTAVTGAWAEKTVETTLWEGTYTGGVEINSTTVSEFNAGDVLRVYVNIPDGGANFKIVYKGEGNDWTETAIPSMDSEWQWLNDDKTYMDITFTEADITALKGTSIYIYKSDQSTITKVTLITPATEPDVEVTTNKAEGETTFTEATFAMPAYDATAEYELVRDMTVDVDATIADRIRIKKENDAYVAVTATELIPAVSDKISGTAVAMTVTTDYTAKLQKKTEGETPTWADATTLSVGTFRYVITGTGLYDGNITTNEFQLFEGYEVTIPAGEYATYFKDEALYVENENAQLYTISSVTESEAVLSSQINVAPANTPLLVYNKSQTETLTFLLIPTTDNTPDNVTAATQFVGTLEATTIPASATGADNYALNGYAFVWVKNEIAVAANKCWLHIVSQPATSRGNTRSITGGNGTTGIDAIENVTIDNEGWYDLQGRKLQSAPNRKGIYIHNGKKVVVRK